MAIAPKKPLVAASPYANPPKRDWHDDGLAILAMLQHDKPEHREAITQLRAECPWKHSICIQTGRRIEPATNHTVAAYWGKMETKVRELRKAGFL